MEEGMSGKHSIPKHMREYLTTKRDELMKAVPDKMRADIQDMLAIARNRGLSHEVACDAVIEALRSQQATHNPVQKAWLVLEAGCMWVEEEKGKA